MLTAPEIRALLTADELQVFAELDEKRQREVIARLTREEQERRDHPLAYAVLWDSERTSQKEAITDELTTGKLHRFLLGGNRSGKSEGAALVDLCYAQGVDHPDVLAFLTLNGIDPGDTDIHKGPGTVWADAPDSNDSRRFVRPKIAKYAPKGSKWRNQFGPGESEVMFPNGGKIVFKSVDQGRDGHQGEAVRRVRFDEEPKDRQVVGECEMRIVDEHGHIAYSMTPLSGWTTLLDDKVRNPDEDTLVQNLHGEDNPHIDTEFLNKILKKKGIHEREARAFGRIVALEGRVYMEWDRSIHVVPSFTPPDEWPRFGGLDFGTRNPTAIGWFALDPRDDTVHLYREHYQSQRSQEWHCRRFLALSKDDPDMDFFVADSAGTAERMTWLGLDVSTIPSFKGAGSVRGGISVVAERLSPDANGHPHFVVHDNCAHTINEIESYIWNTTRTKGDQPDKPLEKNDHMMDLIRYALHHLHRLGGL